MRFDIRTAPRAFVDVETTGLDDSFHEIVEIAIIQQDGTEWSTKIKPEDIGSADPAALAINGYSEEKWETAPSMENVAPIIRAKLMGRIPVAHNAAFDKGFIMRALAAEDLDIRGVGYHWIDTVTLAYHLLVPQGLDRLSLKSVCNRLGVSNEGAHTALADALRCKKVYEALCSAS